MKNDEKQNNDEKQLLLLQILIDKFKYHDSLAYQREGIMWLFQGIILAVIGFVWQIDPNIISLNVKFIVSAVMLSFICAYTVIAQQWVKIDLRVRNAFNKKIVEILTTHTTLYEGVMNEADWKTESHKVENRQHPVNLWHTGEPLGFGKGTTASGGLGIMLIIVTFVEGFAALAAILYLIIMFKINAP